MSGTKAGGTKAAKTNKERHGEDFFKKIGAKGGRNGKGPDYKGGFASNHELAVLAGRKGGAKSRRTGIKNGQSKKTEEKAEAQAEGNMLGLLGRVFGGKKNAK